MYRILMYVLYYKRCHLYHDIKYSPVSQNHGWRSGIGRLKQNPPLHAQYHGTDRYLTEMQFFGGEKEDIRDVFVKREHSLTLPPLLSSNVEAVPQDAGKVVKKKKQTQNQFLTPKYKVKELLSNLQPVHQVICCIADSRLLETQICPRWTTQGLKPM